MPGGVRAGRSDGGQALTMATMRDIVLARPALAAGVLVCLLAALYLFQINRMFSGTPDQVLAVKQKPWTREQLQRTYKHLQESPVDLSSYVSQLPPKLERRYVVTGGSGG